MGRWKGSPQGPYWDPNDTGPNQVDPPPGASPNGPQAPMGAPAANVGDIAGQFPGIPWQGPHQGPWMPQVIDSPPGYDPNHPPHEVGDRPPLGSYDMNGDAPPGYHWEWSGGVTGGKHPVPDGQHDWQVPGQGAPMGPPPDMSGWEHKQYPGGVGGPITPMSGSIGSLGGMTKTAPQSLAQMGGWAKPSGQQGTLSSLMNGGNLAGTGSAFGALFGKR